MAFLAANPAVCPTVANGGSRFVPLSINGVSGVAGRPESGRGGMRS